MKRTVWLICTLLLLFALTGCETSQSGEVGVSIAYGAAAAFAFLLLLGYICFVKCKDRWFVILFSSVLIVNTGYLLLSCAQSLEAALMANRLAYLGSVFLPMSMLMITLNITGVAHSRKLTVSLLCAAGIVFLIAASPGYLDIYYKEVSLTVVDGVSVLKKVYGPWHFIYAVYLVGYFASLVSVVIWASVKKKIDTSVHAAVLAIAVFVNLGVWFVEQLIKFKFEYLAISYIISELFLLCLHPVIDQHKRLKEQHKMLEEQLTNLEKELEVKSAPKPAAKKAEPCVSFENDTERCEYYVKGMSELTATEQAIFDAYLERKTTKEVMEEMNIKENTIKYHNKNIYKKLGVSTRNELLHVYKLAQEAGMIK